MAQTLEFLLEERKHKIKTLGDMEQKRSSEGDRNYSEDEKAEIAKLDKERFGICTRASFGGTGRPRRFLIHGKGTRPLTVPASGFRRNCLATLTRADGANDTTSTPKSVLWSRA